MSTEEAALFAAAGLAVVGGYQCIRSRQWGWVFIAACVLVYTVPTLNTMIA